MSFSLARGLKICSVRSLFLCRLEKRDMMTSRCPLLLSSHRISAGMNEPCIKAAAVSSKCFYDCCAAMI